MDSFQNQLCKYRKAYNPLHLLRYVLGRPHTRSVDLRRLISYFQLERARKVRLLKEDVFIEQAIKASKHNSDLAYSQNDILIKLLEERKLFLVESVNQCFRNNIEINLQKEVTSLNQLIAMLKQQCVTSKKPVQDNPPERQKKAFLRKTMPVSCWIRPKSQVPKRTTKNPIVQQFQEIKYDLPTDSNVDAKKQSILSSLSKGFKRHSRHNRIETQPKAKRSFDKVLGKTSFSKSRFTSWKKPSTAHSNSRMYTTTTAASIFKKNGKAFREDQIISGVHPNNEQKANLKRGSSQSQSSFSQLMESEDIGEEQSDMVSESQIGSTTKPFYAVKRSSSFARNAKHSFNFQRTSMNIKLSDIWDEKPYSLFQEVTPQIVKNQQASNEKIPKQENKQQKPSTEETQVIKTQDPNPDLHSSRGFHSKIIKVLNQSQSESPLVTYNPSSIFKRSNGFNRFSPKDTKVTYSTKSTLFGIKHKNKQQAKPEKRTTSSMSNSNFLVYLQNLYQKFSVFSEDRTILSFKEVKGFLRETFQELKNVQPSFSPQELQQFEKLLKDRELIEKKKNFPPLTMQDLISLIKQISQINAKQIQKTQRYRQRISYKDPHGHSLKIQRSDGRLNSKGYRALITTNLREMFRNETDELRQLTHKTECLNQFTPNTQIQMEVMSRWCKNSCCKLKCNEGHHYKRQCNRT